MEAIATLSLVCNVMQAVSFTGELFLLCRRVCEDGAVLFRLSLPWLLLMKVIQVVPTQA